ncbi:2-oxoglutarate dehydrogenase complex dihydrolipoyllysine-residue succinyltransferase [Malonomonas rubra]|uniref:2-oxoglutarate dehydrogenase complex dihydrolipoyllysine-residue succinyltransferase n=1 Tax=Malonomonas rubra TaxID=57040 RepID=UPI0026EDE7AB|nr:2-oxoglutarate dehydrogenase complex dihydrolipoyllysine-residue succinyltransferase [Malonomonas rubra]
MDIIVPQVGESIVEAEIGEWFKQDGEQVEKDALLLELETEKINVELNAETSGKLTILAKQGEVVKIGAVIGRIDPEAVGSRPERQPEKKTATAKELPPVNPAVPKLAAESGIDLATVSGSGRDGRILVDDLLKKQTSPEESATKPVEPPKEQEDSAVAEAERIKRVPMTQIRKKIAERLLMARQQTAMLTTFNEIDMSRVIKLRNSHKEAFEKKHGVPLGFMSFFVKATAEALKDYPEVNAQIDGNDILYHYYYDIGVAVGSKRGLVVPVIRDADRMHFDEVEKTIRDFAAKAETGKLSLEELQGGTFTISNGGIYGSVLSTPLLNPPQSGILGMHAIKDRAVVIHGEIVIRPIMNVALSYDHRIIDGQQAVSFLKQIKLYIEDPEEMLLEM